MHDPNNNNHHKNVDLQPGQEPYDQNQGYNQNNQQPEYNQQPMLNQQPMNKGSGSSR